MAYLSQVDALNEILARLERVVDEIEGLVNVRIVDGSVTIEAGDIEIGAVEIKDADTDDRARVSASGELVVRDEAQRGIASLSFGSASLAPGGSATIVSETGPASVWSVRATATIDARIEVYIDGSLVDVARTSAAMPTVCMDFYGVPFSTIEVVATNTDTKHAGSVSASMVKR